MMWCVAGQAAACVRREVSVTSKRPNPYTAPTITAMQCVAVCCSVLQCVVVCCSVLQCVAVCCSVLQCVAVRSPRGLCDMTHSYVCHDSFTCAACVCSCVAVCCSVLQCVAVCCSVMRMFMCAYKDDVLGVWSCSSSMSCICVRVCACLCM